MTLTRIAAAGVAAALLTGFGAVEAIAADKVVRVWHTETEPQTVKAFNDIARRFEAKNPGVKIEAEGLAWGDLEGKIMAALAAGNPPELSHGADSDDCGRGFRLNAAKRSDRRRPPVPIEGGRGSLPA